MRGWRLLKRIMRESGALRIYYSFIALFLIIAVLIWLTEPTITTLWDSIWYCFTVTTTIGFGDNYATAIIPRLATMILSFYSIGIVAIMTALITQYFMERMRQRAENTATTFLDKLERLPELSRIELKEISEQAKRLGKR